MTDKLNIKLNEMEIKTKLNLNGKLKIKNKKIKLNLNLKFCFFIWPAWPVVAANSNLALLSAQRK